MKKTGLDLGRPYIKVPLIYMIISSLWIVFSDIISFSTNFVLTPEEIQTTKGLFFIIATTLLIYFLIKSDYKQLQEKKKELANSLEYYFKVLDTFPNPVWKTDDKGRFDYFNTSWYEFLKIEQLSLPAEVIKEFVYSEDQERVLREYSSKISGKGVISLEYRVIDGEGNLHWIRDFGTPVYNSDGVYQGFVGSYSEITDLIFANKEIGKSEERLSLALEATNDALWDWDTDEEFIYWSPSAYMMLGYEPNEFQVTFDKWHELLHKEDRDSSWQSIQNQISGADNTFSLEFRLKCKDDTYKWIRGRGKVVEFKEECKVKRFIGTHVDIDKQKKIEIESHKNRDLLHSILDSSPLAIISLSLDGKVITYNKAAEKIFGWTAEEVIGRSNPIIPSDKTKEHKELIDRVKDGEDLTGLEIIRQNKYGEKLELSIFTGPVRDEKGNVDGLMAVFEDISERKKTVKLLKDSEERFKALHNASFGGITIHDKGLILECNQGLSEITGYSYNELIGMDGLQLIAEETRDMVIDKISTGYENPYEAIGIKKNREKYPLRLEAKNIPYKGKIVRVVEFRDISLQKKVENALKESEEKYRNILSSVHLATVMLDEKAMITFCNQHLLHLTDWKEEEVLGKNWIDLFIPIDIKHDIKKIFQKTINSGEFPTFYENEIVTKSGDVKMIAWNNILTRNSAGHISGVTSIGQDITDKIIAEKELIKSREKYKTVADYTFDWEYWLNEDLQYIYISPSCEDVTGYEPQVFIDDPEFTISIIHPEDREEFKNHFLLNNIKDSELCRLEFRIISKDEAIKWISHHCRPIINDKGKYLGRRGTNREITEIKKALNSLRLSEEKYRSLYNSMNEGFALHTLLFDENDQPVDYVITDVNPSYERILGLSYEECVNKKASVLYGSESPPYLEIYSRVAQSGNPEFFETYFEPMNQYFSISVFSPDQGKFATIFEDITKRKKTEVRIKESEEQFRSIVQNSDAVFFRINKEGVFTLSEGKGLKLLGLSPGQAVGLSAYDMYKDYPDIIGQITRCLSGENVNALINVNEIIFEIFYNPQFNEDGDIIGLYGIAFDITARKTQEENIQILSQAIDQSQVSIVITDTKGKVEYVNPKFTEVTGYALDEVIGQKTNILKSGETEEYEYSNLWRTISSGQQWNGIFHNKKKSGELFWESANISPIKNEKNKITHYVAVKEDITEKMKAEEELEKYRHDLEKLVQERTNELNSQYDFLRTLIDTIPNPVFVKNTRGEYTTVNKAFEKYYRIDSQEIIGKTVDIIADEKTVQITKDIDAELLKSPGTKVYETYHINSKEERRNILVYKATFGMEEDKPEGVAGLILDITDQKQLAEKTKLALEREKELNEMKTSFISMASHEFRTPLTSIMASADLLSMYLESVPNSKVASNISRIQKSVEDMVELLEDVLTLSRTDRGKIVLNPSLVNVNKLINSVVENAELSLKSSQKIILNKKIVEEHINADGKLIKHILENLISNAQKFSPDDSTITVQIQSTSEKLILIVEDQGIGVPEKDIKYIFDPFFRSSNVGEVKGTGLGLSIVKKFVAIHNGSINVESKLNKGSKFRVELSNGWK